MPTTMTGLRMNGSADSSGIFFRLFAVVSFLVAGAHEGERDQEAAVGAEVGARWWSGGERLKEDEKKIEK